MGFSMSLSIDLLDLSQFESKLKVKGVEVLGLNTERLKK